MDELKGLIILNGALTASSYPTTKVQWVVRSSFFRRLGETFGRLDRPPRLSCKWSHRRDVRGRIHRIDPSLDDQWSSQSASGGPRLFSERTIKETNF